tara:strand:- start:4679 stop:4918 length:240 start_codon:yes stop_codon:yes gene_type:complete
MKLIYFSWVKDITNKNSEIISNINDIKELKNKLVETYPKIEKHFSNNILRIAVNNEYVFENTTLNKNDVIAIFPPVSGG